MTEDEIIEIAIQGHASTRDAIRWAMRQEREACAKVCENFYRNGNWITKEEAAAAIRARGEK
jgi:hypothetical protein